MLRPVLRTHGVEATDEEILDLHARTEHRLQATSKKGAYLKYRDVLGWLPAVRGPGKLVPGQPNDVHGSLLRKWDN